MNTQVDDGRPIGEAGCGREVTSSASMPAVVAQMLTALEVEPGMRVLEIGTGTGYNAALLAHQLGAAHVVSVEIDPAVAEHARRALNATGYGQVSVITADGSAGYPPGAPYDRVISTAAAAEVPHAWVAQTRPGGRVLTPWGTAFYPGGLLAFTVDHDGTTATGGIVGPASFMWLRAQRIPRHDRQPQLARYHLVGVARGGQPGDPLFLGGQPGGVLASSAAAPTGDRELGAGLVGQQLRPASFGDLQGSLPADPCTDGTETT